MLLIFNIYALLHGIERLVLLPYLRLLPSTHTRPCEFNITTAVLCSMNTEKCVLYFASQWCNYYYYQTCAATYYKNAELLFAISPL